MAKAQNVLLLMADEHQANAMSCLDHSVVKTPNLDRLARHGTRFQNAYTPSPICVPARASFATGLYSHQTGYWDNAHAYDGRVTGYRNAIISSVHFKLFCTDLKYLPLNKRALNEFSKHEKISIAIGAPQEKRVVAIVVSEL